jgi:DNA-binding response OmpR family regulator
MRGLASASPRGRLPPAMRILLVEDYPPLVRSVTQGLKEAGYTVESAMDGEQGLALAQAAPWDAIILDVMLPRLDGFGVLQALRAAKSQTPVLMLTARDAVTDRVRGLDLGADDYLQKPFAFEELLARLRAVMRRRYQGPHNTLQVADLEIDTVARTVRRGGEAVVLSAREYALLEYLAARTGQVVSRTEIWEHVYDFAADPSSNVIDVYIGYLRKKVDQREPKLIHTRRGLGYVLGTEE